MNPLVKTVQISKMYKLGKTEVNALSQIDMEVNQGEFIAIAGPSGSGKTTLLNLIGCLDSPTSGHVEITGQKTSGLSNDSLADIRNYKIGFIFQTFNLIPVLTAFENVEFPLLLTNTAPREREEKIMAVLEEVGIANKYKHKPEELSGGQRQRVAVARALVKSPEIILADEPTANLDSSTGKTIIQLMLDINKKKGTTFIFSTHDDMIIEKAARVLKIHDGKLQ